MFLDDNMMDYIFGNAKFSYYVFIYLCCTKFILWSGVLTLFYISGTGKFNIEISSWTFCAGTACQQNEVGKYLDFDIVIKGKSGSAKKDTSATKTYTLGQSGSVTLSSKVNIIYCLYFIFFFSMVSLQIC